MITMEALGKGRVDGRSGVYCCVLDMFPFVFYVDFDYKY